MKYTLKTEATFTAAKMKKKLSIFNAMTMFRPKAGMISGATEMMKGMTDLIKNDYPAPLMVNWHCHDKCNYKCFYCPMSDENYKCNPNVLPKEKALKLVDELADSGVKGLIITGGETLLHPHIVDLIDHTNTREMDVSIVSNMSLVTSDMRQTLVDAGLDRIIVSLDTSSADKYAANKGVDNHQLVLDNIKAAAKAGVEIVATMAITRANKDELEDFVQICIAHGVTSIMIWFPVANEENIDSVLNAQERFEFYERIYYLSKKVYSEIALLCHPCDGLWIKTLLDCSKKDGNRMEHMRMKMIASMSRGCYAATFLAGLSIEGNVHPCGSLIGGKGGSCGNLFDDGFSNVWKNNEIMKQVRNRELKGQCNVCEHKKICGGCRTISWLTTGDYLESDATCIYASDNPQDTSRICVKS